MSANNEKAQRYIGLLEAARVAGNWQELPELIRKVTKHAPDRKCLIQVARFDVDVAGHATSAGRRPGTATNNTTIPDTQVSSLETELRAAGQPFEEVVQGQTSLLWARWVGSLKEDHAIPSTPFEPVRTAADATSLWTKVCVVKAVYIRGMLCVHAGEESQGREHHEALIPWLDSNRSLVVSTPQLLYWAQQLLGRVALQRMTATADAATSTSDEKASFRLQAFRHWAVLAARNQDVPPTAFGNGPGHVSKLEMWRAYYRFLSAILQNRTEVSIGRSELALELRRVETSYENELLRQAQFPKATESNTAIEEWVEEFIRNWGILCGPGWSDSDLGEGGRNSCGRNVLDMLYRAASKSFHSTLILRRLFQVHKVLTDFDLAYKALDTYIELMDRARERATKSSGQATERDSDDVYLTTIAEGIEGLCSFGRQAEAEKAYGLSLKLEHLLNEVAPPHSDSVPNGSHFLNGDANGHSVPAMLSPHLVEAFHRAIGIGKCHWAQWTPFSENRATLQSEAVEHLRKAAALDLPAGQQLKTLYALSRLLADTREIDQAISVVKQALATEATTDDEDRTHGLQRQLVPFWHLLTLLLTSRQTFDLASQSCVAAFEQFSPPEVLFGAAGNAPGDAEKEAAMSRKTGLVDDMECDELQRIIEIRITDLALTELTEGHEQAVNSSNELLSLYSQLFGRHGVIAMNMNEERSGTKLLQAPKSSAGTVRSLRSNIFHRKRIGRSSESSRGVQVNATPSIAGEKSRPTAPNAQTNQNSQAPTIHVSHDDEKLSPHKHKLFHSHDHSKEEKRHSSGTLEARDSRRRRSRSREAGEGSHGVGVDQPVEVTQEKAPTETSQLAQRPRLETIQSQDVPAVPVSADHDSSEGAKQQLKEIPHNLEAHDKVPPPAQHQEQPPEQDVRLPVASSRPEPITRFSRTASQRHALSLLVKIWLIIATLYRRANMFDDSREACDEAAKVAMKIETMIAAVESSARAFSDPGWGGGGKSSDELWADVYCERAELLMAIARAREEKEGDVYSEGVREALDQYEQCLMYSADHAGGIVGLSNVLLDYYERKVELARRIDNSKAKPEDAASAAAAALVAAEESQRRHRRDFSRGSAIGTTNGVSDMDAATSAGLTTGAGTTQPSSTGKEDDLKKTPENLNRLAARDRAYGLLSSLTKLGSGWDDAQAWYALARAHELGGEVDKAKEILWWCVELEDTRPIRHWRNIGCGGYVL